MAKKSTTRKTDPGTGAPADSTPAKPRARARSMKNAAPDITAPSAAADSSAAPGAATTSVSMASEPSEEDIRLRAYHRYLERGGTHGMDFDDWLQAKQDLMRK